MEYSMHTLLKIYGHMSFTYLVPGHGIKWIQYATPAY